MEKYITYKKNPNVHYSLSLLILAWTFVLFGLGFIMCSIIYADRIGPVILVGILTGVCDIVFGLIMRFGD